MYTASLSRSVKPSALRSVQGLRAAHVHAIVAHQDFAFLQQDTEDKPEPTYTMIGRTQEPRLAAVPYSPTV